MTVCWGIFFLQLYEFALYETYKFIYLSSYIEHSWKFIRIYLYMLKLTHSQLIFFE